MDRPPRPPAGAPTPADRLRSFAPDLSDLSSSPAASPRKADAGGGGAGPAPSPLAPRGPGAGAAVTRAPRAPVNGAKRGDSALPPRPRPASADAATGGPTPPPPRPPAPPPAAGRTTSTTARLGAAAAALEGGPPGSGPPARASATTTPQASAAATPLGSLAVALGSGVGVRGDRSTAQATTTMAGGATATAHQTTSTASVASASTAQASLTRDALARFDAANAATDASGRGSSRFDPRERVARWLTTAAPVRPGDVCEPPVPPPPGRDGVAPAGTGRRVGAVTAAGAGAEGGWRALLARVLPCGAAPVVKEGG